MEVIVKKQALTDLISDLLKENRTDDAGDYTELEVADEEGPIIPDSQMSIQLSAARPPVDDPEYIPASLVELGLAASVISEEVPANQIEYFYRMLHKLLDKSLDRHDEKGIANLQEAIKLIIEKESDQDDDEPDEGIVEGFYTSMYITILNNKTLFLPAGVVATTGRIEDTPENRDDMKVKMFNFLANHVDFRDMNVNDAGLRNARKRAVEDAVTHFFYKSAPLTDQEKAELAKAAKTGVAERAELKAKQEAIRTAVGLWDTTQGDLDAISTAMEELIVSVSGTPEEIYLQHALDTVEHIAVAHVENVDKSRFKQALKAVLLSDDLSPTNADEIFEIEDDSVMGQKAEKAKQKRKKSEDKKVWANIAKVAGFSGPSGAKQYTRPAMLKVMVQSTGVFSDDNSRVAMSRSARAFRSAIAALVDQGKMDTPTGRTLMASARPNAKDNELFRIFVKEYFWQPFVNFFDKTWKAKASDLYMTAGVPENIAKSDTFVRLAVGETNWDSDTAKKKIESAMPLEDFKKVRSQTQNFVRSPENIEFWNKFSKDFINKISGVYIGDDPKDAKKVKMKADKAANDTLALILRDKKGELAYVKREREA